MKSEKLEFEKLNNVRDLGSLVTKDGKRIAKGKLLRSGHLTGASESDIEKLSKMVEIIFDFRSKRETIEKADPEIKGAEKVNLPVIRELTEGITREKKATLSLVQRFADNSEGARNHMIYIYKSFVTDELPITSYKTFIELLLKKRDKAALWHCTAGKDRAGFGAVIIEELLGVAREDIFEDYLYTNECIKDEVAEIALRLSQKYLNPEPSSDELSVFNKTIEYLFGAKEEYLLGVYQKIEELYGDFNGFIRDGLKISKDKIDFFKNIYLS
ncbi:MAG: tyrosine-protein phosphatase [Candidatus Riflebacteria bacterium]|nr:tyrosine-protein phosphatase [Candidatus Riflebacteria bacterium]